MKLRLLFLALFIIATSTLVRAQGFDHQHAAWNALLAKHVKPFDASTGRLHVSKIFDWYGKDFEQGHQGYDSLQATFARHAGQLAAAPEARTRLRNGDYRIEFLDYD